jgi:hypothetical protein
MQKIVLWYGLLVINVFYDQHVNFERLSSRRVSIADSENAQNFSQQRSMSVLLTICDVSKVVWGKLLQEKFDHHYNDGHGKTKS